MQTIAAARLLSPLSGAIQSPSLLTP
jgi:hypothetical protein